MIIDINFICALKGVGTTCKSTTFSNLRTSQLLGERVEENILPSRYIAYVIKYNIGRTCVFHELCIVDISTSSLLLICLLVIEGFNNDYRCEFSFSIKVLLMLFK